MTNPILLETKDGEGKSHYYMFCPGCNEIHGVDERWDFNDNFTYPTFGPSLLVTTDWHEKGKGHEKRRCHSFIKGGEWVFLKDSNHELAGKRVKIPPLPDWVMGS